MDSKLVKAVAIALGKSDFEQQGQATLEDADYVALREMMEKLHQRAMNSRPDWLDANFGPGMWQLYLSVYNGLMVHEESCRSEKGFSTWPIHAAKLLEETEWKLYQPEAVKAIEAVHQFYGEKSLKATLPTAAPPAP